MLRKTASYVGLRPASETASAAARGASRKSGTKPELLLRQALKRAGVRVSTTKRTLPGQPGLVFVQPRIVVFVDGDYWHGRHWAARKKKLNQGTNAAYWVSKIDGNRKRDRENNRVLRADGWTVLRFWETDIARRADVIAGRVAKMLVTRRAMKFPRSNGVTPIGARIRRETLDRKKKQKPRTFTQSLKLNRFNCGQPRCSAGQPTASE